MSTIKFKSDAELEVTSVVLKTKHISVVRDGRKFYLVNTKKVKEGRKVVCLKASENESGVNDCDDIEDYEL